MEKLIACCGINCITCDARIATINNDEELRKTTAEKWREAFSAPDITPEMINCTGCRQEGAKFGHCYNCEIRNCVIAKGFNTCGDCKEMNDCTKVAGVHKYLPEAITNLRDLEIGTL
jgi:hypothetical protein